MAKLLCVLFALLFLNVWAASEEQLIKTETIAVEPFSAIHDCLPMNVKVEPSSAIDEYFVSIEGEESLLEAIDVKVDSGVLFLGLKRGFETQRATKVTIQMPANALDTLEKSSTKMLIVAPGLQTEKLTVKTRGTAGVRIFGADIDDLDSEADGTSNTFVDGIIKKARLDVSGTAKTYVYGLSSDAEVRGKGVGSIYIDAENNDVEVEGRVKGVSHVYLTTGHCHVRDSTVGSACEKVKASDLPDFEAKFSCGLIVKGKISCGKNDKESTDISSGVHHSSGTTVVSSSSTSFSGSSSVKISSTTKTSDSVKISTSGSGKASVTTSTSSSSSFSSDDDDRDDDSDDDRDDDSDDDDDLDDDLHFSTSVSIGDDADVVAVESTKCLDKDIDMFDRA